ncbi:hypothetical protein KM043_012468 [Ampulex compressa]|nr:hypothetical protein KM043_012468 [Ampulex compressa]
MAHSTLGLPSPSALSSPLGQKEIRPLDESFDRGGPKFADMNERRRRKRHKRAPILAGIAPRVAARPGSFNSRRRFSCLLRIKKAEGRAAEDFGELGGRYHGLAGREKTSGENSRRLVDVVRIHYRIMPGAVAQGVLCRRE